MSISILWVIAQRELRDALKNKWLWLYALGFAGLALALSQAGVTAAGYAGLGGFGRTAASLINALLLFVPLMGLSVGASVLAHDRERGTLLYLLAQPVSRAEVFWGKALGAALGLLTAVSLGFGLAALGLAVNGDGEATAYLALAGYSLLLALVTLGLGLLISAFARKSATAIGAALSVWLALAFAGDLATLGATLAFRPTPNLLLGWLLINPLQVFKLGAIYSLRATLDTLGAAGQYALYRFGDWLPALLVSVLVTWLALTFGAAFMVFNRRGDV